MPNNETTPHKTHIIRHKPIELDAVRTLLGETKIPEPIYIIIIKL